jgi:hypothetical protein
MRKLTRLLFTSVSICSLNAALFGCMPQQQNEIEQLRADVAALRQEVAALKTPPAASVTASNALTNKDEQKKSTESQATPTPVANDEFVELEKRFDEEKRDAKWARLREAPLLTAFSKHIKGSGAALNTVICKASLCRAVVLVPKGRAASYKPIDNVWAGTKLIAHARPAYGEKTRWAYVFARHEKDIPELGAERVDPLKLAQSNPELVLATQVTSEGATAAPVNVAPAASDAKPATKLAVAGKVAEPAKPVEPVHAAVTPAKPAAPVAKLEAPAAKAGSVPGTASSPAAPATPAVKDVTASTSVKTPTKTIPASAAKLPATENVVAPAVAPVAPAGEVKAPAANAGVGVNPKKPETEIAGAAAVKAPATTAVKAPATTAVKAPATTAVKAPATTAVKAPATTAVKAPATTGKATAGATDTATKVTDATGKSASESATKATDTANKLPSTEKAPSSTATTTKAATTTAKKAATGTEPAKPIVSATAEVKASPAPSAK